MSWHAKVNNIKRILMELQIISQNEEELKDDGIIIECLNDDIYRYSVCLTFSNMNQFYSGQSYFLKMELSDDYPCHAPYIEFISQIFHPNVDQETGRFCQDFYAPSEWSARNTIQSFVYALQYLIQNPVYSAPENKTAHDLFFNYTEKFKEQTEVVFGLNGNGAFIEETFSLPEAVNTKYERSRYLEKADNDKEYVKLVISEPSRPETTKWASERECSAKSASQDGFNFLESGEVESEIVKLSKKPRLLSADPQKRLLYTYCGKVMVRDGISRITKVEPVVSSVMNPEEIDEMMLSAVKSVALETSRRSYTEQGSRYEHRSEK